MNVLRRWTPFITVLLAAAAWPMLTTVFETPSVRSGAWLLGFAALVAVVGAVVVRRRVRALAEAAVFFVLLLAVQWLMLHAAERLMAAEPECFGFPQALAALLRFVGLDASSVGASVAQALAALLRFVGLDASPVGASVAVVTMRETYVFPAGLELLGFPGTFLALAGAFIAVLVFAPPRKRLRAATVALAVWVVYLPLRAALAVLVFVHMQAYVDYFSKAVRVDVLFGAWWQLAMLAPLAAGWGLFVLPRSAEETEPEPAPGPARPRAASLATLAALAGAALLVVALYWNEAGTPAAKRVMIDEGHSDWEKSTRAPGTQWHGTLSMYNMFSIIDYLGYYYAVARNDAPLLDNTLARTDVLVLKTPTRAYAPDEIDALERFVRRGGGLFVIGEHSNFVGSAVYLNSIASRFGLKLREDCVFNLVEESPFVEVWERPALGYHPIVANIPWFRFEVSCSVSPGLSGAQAVMLGRGLYRLDADYFIENYYPLPKRGPSMRFGPIAQLAARDAGRGRIAVFTDSTTMSNFSAFYPGRAELMLASVDWLGRTHTNGLWRWVVALAGAGLLAGSAYRLLRAPHGLGGLLAFAAAAAAGGALALWTSTAATARAFELPAPHTPPVHVGFLRSRCDYLLPDRDFVTNPSLGYDLFYQSALRMRCFPRVRETLADVSDERLLVIINPSEEFSPQDVKALRAYLEGGARVLVLLRTDTKAPAARSVLEPFGLGLADSSSGVPAPVVTETRQPTGITTTGRALTGGSPLLYMGDDVVAARVKVGKGELVVFGIGDAFRDSEMGYVNAATPTPEILARFRMEYGCLDFLRERLPEGVKREVNADTRWMRTPVSTP